MTDPTSTPQPAHSARRRKILMLLVAAIVVPIMLFSIFAGIALNWAYSEGDRAGILQKLSRKGWLCKTWEGELAMTTVPGVAPTLWEFTIRDDAAAHRVAALLGKRVILHYEEHRGVPTRCFGDTPYFVDSVSLVATEP